jgi:GAF domain-containing protein
MQKIESGDLPKEWYLLVDDMEEELAAIKKVRRRYSEPQDNVLDMYRSCLIVPVTNMAATKQVIGFICVDSRRKGAFNTGYDLQFLQEFADNAAIATCLYFGALQSKGRRLEAEKEALTS